MAKRGMLPKFRPAQLGRDASARPTIRPVKASPPPPPPSPPRRMASGFSPKGGAAAALAPLDSEGDRATAIAPYGEPATLDRAHAHHARSDEELPSTTAVPRGRVDAMLVSFEDETQARQPDDRLLDGMRGEPTLAPYTQPAAQAPADMNVPYDSLPSLEVRRPYDTYEAAFSERDPVTAMHAQHDSAHVRRAEPATHPAEKRAPDPITPVAKLPSFRESFSSIGADSAAYDQRAFNDPDFNARAPRNPVYDDGAYRAPAPPVNDYEPSVETEAPPAWNAPRREESGPRERPRNDYEPVHTSPPWNGRDLPYDMHDAGASRMMDHVDDRAPMAPTGFSTMPPSPEMAPLARESYPAAEPYIPPAPRVPAEAREAAPFVMGVQPIRNNANRTDAWPPAPVMAPMQQPPYGHLPSPMQAMHMPHGSSMPPAYAQPQPYVQASPRVMATTPQPGSLSPQVMPHAHPSQRGQVGAPMNTTLGAQPQNRIGRFAWFVAGVAFGITFAIFATGFFGTGSVAAPKAASEPPAAATAPAQAAPPPPAQTAAATAPTTAAPVPAPPPVGTVATTTPSALPAAGAAAVTPATPAAPATPAVTPRAQVAQKAPPPVIRRSTPASRRQFNAPATSEARPVRAGGDDEGGGGGRAAAPPPEAGDLLGAALR